MERILRYINSFHLFGTHSIKKVGRLRLVCLKPETLDQLGTALALSSFKYTPSTHNNTLQVLQRTTLDPAPAKGGPASSRLERARCTI
jgi:hypothetical protein